MPNIFNPLNIQYSLPVNKAKVFNTIEFDLIDACQLKCPLCLRQERDFKPKPKRIDIKRIKKAINNLKGHSKFDIRLVRLIGTVSEPTLYPKLIELIEFLNKNDISVQISTNGNNVPNNESFWKNLKCTLSGNCQNEILFAIESIHKYDTYRRGGVICDVINNLKTIAPTNNTFHVGIQYIKFQHNIGCFQDIKDMVKSKNIPVSFYEVFHSNEPEKGTTIKPRKDILEGFYNKRKKINDAISMDSVTLKDIICVSEQYGELFVDTKGEVYPCTNLFENKGSTICTLDDIHLKFENIVAKIQKRNCNPECFKACSKFGHNLEKKFLRARYENRN